MPSHRTRWGATVVELLIAIVSIVVLLAIVLPVSGGIRSRSRSEVSLNNLIMLGVAHAVYAADHDGRQLTYAVDDLSSYGATCQEALTAYNNAHPEGHPDIVAGWGPYPGHGVQMWGYWLDDMMYQWAVNPILFLDQSSSLAGFGQHRMGLQQKAFHDYVSGRYYDEVYFAPEDAVPVRFVAPAFDLPWEFAPSEYTGGKQVWSTYCFSAAAWYDPAVFANPDLGGWIDPWSIDTGLNVPAMSQALYPSLKTMFMEHHWLPNPVAPCNPAIPDGWYDGCEPYYFNHGLASAPATIFYDLSTRRLPVTEVIAADEQLVAQVGYGLWSRDTGFGEAGYFGDDAYDPIAVSHHVLTTDGIRGRDTLPTPPAAKNTIRRRNK